MLYINLVRKTQKQLIVIFDYNPKPKQQPSVKRVSSYQKLNPVEECSI